VNAESIARILGWMKGGISGDQASPPVRNALAALEAATSFLDLFRVFASVGAIPAGGQADTPGDRGNDPRLGGYSPRRGLFRLQEGTLMSWRIRQTDGRVGPVMWEVGFYHPDGGWCAEGMYDTREEAAARARELNGRPQRRPWRIYTVLTRHLFSASNSS
jgi:hypothetical protein